MGPEGAERCTNAEEQRLGVDVRTAFLEVIHDGIADFLGQRELCLTTPLSTHPHRGFLPVDIRETKLYDVSGPKPHTGEEKEYRAISPAHRCAEITRGDDPFHLFGEEIPRKRGEAPLGQNGNGCFKARGTVPFNDEKAKEHTESRGTLFCCPVPRCLKDKLPQAPCIEPAGIFSKARE
jgi:hypothetical protein